MKPPPNRSCIYTSYCTQFNPFREHAHSHYDVTDPARPHGLDPHNNIQRPDPKRATAFLTRLKVRWQGKPGTFHLPRQAGLAHHYAILLHTLPEHLTFEGCGQLLAIRESQLLESFLYDPLPLVHGWDKQGNPSAWIRDPKFAFPVKPHEGGCPPHSQLIALSFRQLPMGQVLHQRGVQR